MDRIKLLQVNTKEINTYNNGWLYYVFIKAMLPVHKKFAKREKHFQINLSEINVGQDNLKLR